MNRLTKFWKNWVPKYSYFDIVWVVVGLIAIYIFDLFVDHPVISLMYLGYGIILILNLHMVGLTRYDGIANKDAQKLVIRTTACLLFIGLMLVFLIGRGDTDVYLQGVGIELIGAVATFALLEYSLSMLRTDNSSGISTSELQALRQELQEIKELLKMRDDDLDIKQETLSNQKHQSAQ